MSRKFFASSLIALAGLASAHAFAADMSSVEAVRGEQLSQLQTSAAAAPARNASTNDFLQEAERGEYLRSVGISSQRVAHQAAASDSLMPAEATRGAKP